MPPHVLPTHLFGGICRGHVTSRTHPHSRLPPLRVRAAQALPVKGFPKGKPLWPLFRAFLAGQKGTSWDQRRERNKNRKKHHISAGWGPPAPKERRTTCRHVGASLTDLAARPAGPKSGAQRFMSRRSRT